MDDKTYSEVVNKGRQIRALQEHRSALQSVINNIQRLISRHCGDDAFVIEQSSRLASIEALDEQLFEAMIDIAQNGPKFDSIWMIDDSKRDANGRLRPTLADFAPPPPPDWVQKEK